MIAHIERHNTWRRHAWLLAAGASATALISSAATAQTLAAPPATAADAATANNSNSDQQAVATSDQSTVRDIIVTAQRRVQRDIDVPESITTLDATQIQNITASFLIDIGNKVPNVLFLPGTNSPSIAIRGVSSQSNVNAGFPPAIGVYVDEVYQGRDPTFNVILNDIDRVEVLRGPQGTLYGRNTIGGAINIITRDPTNDFHLSGDVMYGRYDLFQARGSIGGALIPDRLMVTVSGEHRQREGFIRDTTTGQDLNGLNSDGGRIVILSNLSDHARLRLSADYYTEHGTTALETGPVTLGNLALFSGIPPQDPADNVVQLNSPETSRRELYGFAGRLDVDLPFARLTSITAYRAYNSDQNDDSDGLPVDAFSVGREEDGNNFSQELRLTSTGHGPISWITGLYYYHENTDNFRRIHLGTDMPFLLVGNLTPIVFPRYTGESARTDSHINSDSYAAFGSLTWQITPHLSFTGGIRYTWESKDFTYRQFYTQQYSGGLGGSIIPNFAVNIPQTSDHYRDGQATGDATLSYAFTPDQVGYIRYSRGFKAGGFQTDVISPPFSPTDPLGFGPEFVNNYEVGFKTYLFNHRLRIDLAAFRMDWSDKQEQIFTGLSFLIRNAAQARSQGVELQMTAQPLPGLSLDANLGYLDTSYTSFPGNSLEGRNFPNLPNWTGSFGVQYVFGVAGNLDLSLRGDFNYRGQTYNQPNTNVFITSDALATIDGRVGLQQHDGRWGLYLWGRNLGNVRRLGPGSTFPFPFATITTRSPGFGSTYGVELRFNI